MKRALGRGAMTLPALAAVALVGCAGGPATDRPAGALLQAANSQALHTSFKLDFHSRLQVDLSGVTLPSGVSPGELGLAQAAINAARLTGTVRVQSQKQFQMTFTLSPLLTQPWHLIDVNGTEYISENGTQWHTLAGTQPGLAGGLGSAAGGGLSHFKAEVKIWGQELRHAATVNNLGQSGSGAARVDHLQTTVFGTALNQSLAQILSGVAAQLGSVGASLNAQLPAIERLLQFTGVKSDSYVLTSTGKLARSDLTVGLNLNLAELAGLVPGQSGLPGGSMSMTFSFAGSFSQYGQSFNIQKPSHIVTGPLPRPSGLAGALSPA